jgi:hypothetical protein
LYNGYETEELVAAHITALLRELEVAERTGNGLRADQVRAQLRAFGHKAEAPAKRAERRPAAAAAKAEKR